MWLKPRRLRAAERRAPWEMEQAGVTEAEIVGLVAALGRGRDQWRAKLPSAINYTR
jgi:hypothetical protein